MLAIDSRAHTPFKAITDDGVSYGTWHRKSKSREGGAIRESKEKRGEIAASHTNTAFINGAELRRATDPL